MFLTEHYYYNTLCGYHIAVSVLIMPQLICRQDKYHFKFNVQNENSMIS